MKNLTKQQLQLKLQDLEQLKQKLAAEVIIEQTRISNIKIHTEFQFDELKRNSLLCLELLNQPFLTHNDKSSIIKAFRAKLESFEYEHEHLPF